MIKIIYIISHLLILSALAMDIEIDNSTSVDLRIKKSELILLNFPFKIKSANDIEVFGPKEKAHVKFKKKSVYFASSILPIKMLIYGGEKPIYINFKYYRGKKGEDERVFSFYNTTHEKQINNENIINRDVAVVAIVKKITSSGELHLNQFKVKEKDKLILINGVQIHHLSTYKTPTLNIEKYLIVNSTESSVSLRKIKMFYKGKSEKVVANIFGNGNGELGVRRSTWAFVFKKPKNKSINYD